VIGNKYSLKPKGESQKRIQNTAESFKLQAASKYRIQLHASRCTLHVIQNTAASLKPKAESQKRIQNTASSFKLQAASKCRIQLKANTEYSFTLRAARCTQYRIQLKA
jgi:hypothetical protein